MTTNQKEGVEQFVYALTQKDYAGAEQSFNAVMATKVNAAIENLKVDTADDMFNYQGALSEEYSEKNPKIDLHHKETGDYIASTNWSPTVKHAVAAYETKNPKMKGMVKGFKDKKIRESEELQEASSRKDFVLAANTIKQISDPSDRQKAANLHAEIYAKSNPRFDHARFHAACGTKHGA